MNRFTRSLCIVGAMLAIVFALAAPSFATGTQAIRSKTIIRNRAPIRSARVVEVQRVKQIQQVQQVQHVQRIQQVQRVEYVQPQPVILREQIQYVAPQPVILRQLAPSYGYSLQSIQAVEAVCH